MDRYIVECRFDAPITEEEDKASARAIDAHLSGGGGRWVRSYYSEDRRRLICEFEARDADTLAKAWEGAGHPGAEVWRAQLFEAQAVGAGPGEGEVRWDG